MSWRTRRAERRQEREHREVETLARAFVRDLEAVEREMKGRPAPEYLRDLKNLAEQTPFNTTTVKIEWGPGDVTTRAMHTREAFYVCLGLESWIEDEYPTPKVVGIYDGDQT